MRFYRENLIYDRFFDSLVISRMTGARNGQHSVQTIFTANLLECDVKRKNTPTGPAGKSSVEFNKIYLTERWIPKTDRSLVTWELPFRFYSNQVFVLLAPPQSLNVMNGCGLSLVFPLCITLSGCDLQSNGLYKLGGFCLALISLRWNGH